MQESERLQKYMASCGVASRRKCEEYILAGRVAINGVVVTTLGVKVNNNDIVTFDGKEIGKEELVYYVLYKPTGYITTLSDDRGRRTVMDLFDKDVLNKRIFPIGRLDYDTSGVLLFTNDGELSYRLTKSKKEVLKVYQARIDGIITQEAVTKLIKGVMIDGIMTKKASVDVISIDDAHNSSLVKIGITEGRYHQVRKMFEVLGYEVKKLKRLEFASINLNNLNIGEYRPLKPHEIKKLYSL